MRQRLICGLLIVVGLVFSTQSAVSQDIPFQVHFIDVGQGDSILVQAPDGTTTLIDGGNANGEALSYLHSLGIQRITAIIATHPHADHIGGLIDVMDSLKVDAIWTSGAIHTTGVFERFLDAIDSHQIPYFEATQNDTITVGSLIFDVVYGQESSSNLNNTSLVLHLRYGQVSFLFTGDAETSAEKDMISTVESARLNSTVLKVGHHGSSTSSSLEFLNVVRPQIAIYSAGSGNGYGHPHSQTIDNLLAVGALVYGTDDAGTVIVETDGASLQVHTTSPATLELSTVQTYTVLHYDPFGPDRDCRHFDTHEEAQAFFIAAGGPERDPHRLDGDNDGIACESLP